MKVALLASITLLSAILCGATSVAAAQEPTAPDVVDPAAQGRAAPAPDAPLPSPVAIPLERAIDAQLTRRALSAKVHDQPLHCEGVSLRDLLGLAGIFDKPLHGAALSRYVLVTARDGYRVVFSLAELDPNIGHTEAWVVDRCNDKTLDSKDGPLRLIVPNEKRTTRWVRQLETIAVVMAP